MWGDDYLPPGRNPAPDTGCPWITARLEEDLGCDSLDVVEILMALESEFDILSTPEDDAAVSTVGDLLALVERLVGAKA